MVDHIMVFNLSTRARVNHSTEIMDANLGAGCQKELEERVFMQERLFSTIRYSLGWDMQGHLPKSPAEMMEIDQTCSGWRSLI